MQSNQEPTLSNAFRANSPVPIPFQADENRRVKSPEFHKKQSPNEPLIYQPHWITGGAKHPGLIVETPGLANVAPPPITYQPQLPHSLSDLGFISAFQFERVIYAGAAHESRLAEREQEREFPSATARALERPRRLPE